MPSRRLAAVLTVLVTAVLLPGGGPAVADPVPAPAAAPKIAPDLAQRLRSAGADDRVEALVMLRANAAPAATGAAGVQRELTAAAEASQAPVVDAVEARGDEVLASFWLKNMVLVRATPDSIRALTTLPGVRQVIPNVQLKPPADQPVTVSRAATAASTWGLAKIGADRVQDERGITGKGVRVAILDTGIDIAHPDLAGKLVSDDAADPSYPGGWMEFGEDGRPVASQPHDSSTHGTHVAGTIAGGDASGTRIGVAPGAELMAGMVIPGGSGSFAQVIAGMQWAIAPYDADGNPAGRRADVVSMSLGGEGHADEMIEPARNIRAAGAFPAFAIGNDCAIGSSSSPGNVYESVAVGATDASDDVAGFSCGEVVDRDDWFDAPADWPDSYVVPDVSAPGVDVMSSVPGGGYDTYSGTSMATPHVSGTVALMLQARPGMSVDETLGILTGTAFSDDRYGARPNARFGYGRIDAYAAVAEAALTSGIRGTVVSSSHGHRVLGGVTVSRAGSTRTVQTDAAGRFSLRLPAGRYELRLSRFGYVSAVERITVRDGRYAGVRLELDPTRRGTVSGRVSYGPTGSTVPGATVRVLDVPDPLTAVTDKHGRYTIKDVPVGVYDVQAVAPGLSRSAPRRVVASGRADLTLPKPFPTERVSLSSGGGQVNGDTWWPDLSADGRVVVYGSFANNLVPGDANGELDVFATDRATGTTTLVSATPNGATGNSFSLSPTVSADGRLVGFNSGASDLVAGDANGQTDAFVRDLTAGRTEVVSVSSEGALGNGLSGAPSFSADGRYAVFISDSSNLVPGDTNGSTDVFVRDRVAHRTSLVSVAAGGGRANASSREASVSADGRYVAFHSDASDLVGDDTNGLTDVFVRDLVAGSTERVPAPYADESREPVISADGRLVTFTNRGSFTGLSQIWAYDRQARTTSLVSANPAGVASDGYNYGQVVSADGRFVAFNSDSTNVVPGDTNNKPDVFVRDLRNGTTELVSNAPDGPGDGWSELPALSADGRYVAFQSSAANLVDGDTDNRYDIFVRDRFTGPQARFALSDLDAPSSARVGRTVQVSAAVKNVGEIRGSYEALLRVDGTLVSRRTVSLSRDHDTVLRFDVRLTTPGPHTLHLGPLITTVTIRP